MKQILIWKLLPRLLGKLRRVYLGLQNWVSMSPKEKEEKREEQEEEKEEGNSFQNKPRDLTQDEINMHKSKPFVQNESRESG